MEKLRTRSGSDADSCELLESSHWLPQLQVWRVQAGKGPTGHSGSAFSSHQGGPQRQPCREGHARRFVPCVPSAWKPAVASDTTLLLGRQGGHLHALKQGVQGRCLVIVVLLQSAESLLLGEPHVHNLCHLLVVGRLVLRGEGLRPVLGGLAKELAVRLVHLGDLRILRVAGLRSRQERLYRKQGCPNRKRRAPFLAEHVEADRARLRRDVRVPDLGVELHLRGVVRVIGGYCYVDGE
mmetsp:Transcript_49373/g.130484  ORF Transcript_49373/g.130484 Transcript_49373/m.130484 type:complete len:238 (-) Transcript_49373:301-1014(-)